LQVWAPDSQLDGSLMIKEGRRVKEGERGFCCFSNDKVPYFRLACPKPCLFIK
jgi:hypothetical protein